MKPIRVEMQAFEAYAGTEVIDFGRLNGRTLFLIHGPTGSGKSSLLDAICFALYGESAGGERDPRELRSHRAEPDLDTRVRFDFSLGPTEKYRIERSPAQERPKRRGEGLVQEPPRATLWRRTGLTDDSEEGEVLATKWSDVNAYVERLLTFRANEFRQVVLLPQGKFQSFLLANSVERQEILETLFNTSLYRLIEGRLKERAGAVRDRMQTLLEQQGAENLETLRTKETETTNSLAQCKGDIEICRSEIVRLQGEAQRAKTTLEWFSEQEQANQALANLLGQEPDQRERRRVLDRAEKAKALEDVMNQAARREQEYRNSQKAAKEAEAHLHAAQRRMAQATEALTKEKENDRAREEVHNRIVALEAITPKVQEFEAATAKKLEVTQKEKDAAVARDAVKQSMADTKAERAAKQKELKTKQTLAGDAKALRAELTSLKTALKSAKTLQDKVADQKRIDRTIKTLTAQLETCQAAFKEATRNYDSLHQHWVKGQAARLAKTLGEGEACPVCGSTDHPKPAKSRVELPGDDELEQAKVSVDELHDQVTTQQGDLDGLEKDRSGLEGALDTLRQQLGELAAVSVTEIEKRVEKLTQKSADANEASDAAEQLEKVIAKLNTKEEELAAALDKAEQKLRHAAEKRAEADGAHKELVSGLPKGIRSLAALQQQITEQEAAHTEMQRRLDQAMQEERSAKEDATAKEVALNGARSAETTASTRAEQARHESAQRMQSGGFTDSGDYQSAVRDADTMSDLRETIEQFANTLSGARAQAAATEKKVQGIQKPDLAPIEKALSDANQKAADVANRQGQLQALLDHTRSAIQTMEKLAEAIAIKDKEYQIVGRIAEVANGTNRFRMPFQSYVLTVFLDDVLRSASERFHRMSQSRYLLQRQTEATGGRGRAGLDIEVYDAYSGTTRSTKTLSGGEQFMASLSLALGLADVVRAFAGGVQLETVFVDEGFGSLDGDTLEQAMQVLFGLQESGRLVGVISHVAEMKERIPARLEIIPGTAGSRAVFML